MKVPWHLVAHYLIVSPSIAVALLELSDDGLLVVLVAIVNAGDSCSAPGY